MDAADLAHRVLPVLDDLWGAPWARAADDDVAVGSAGALAQDACLGDAFPERDVLHDAEASFQRVRGDALVHAISTVLRDEPSASLAWSLLAAGEFNECFAASVAASVDLDGPIELLGPVSSPTIDGPAQAAGTDVRVATHRARLSAASAEGLRPITLDVAIVGRGRVVLLVWAATGAEPEAVDGWRDLIDACVRRVATVGAADGA